MKIKYDLSGLLFALLTVTVGFVRFRVEEEDKTGGFQNRNNKMGSVTLRRGHRHH